jgi:hypothetical protein
LNRLVTAAIKEWDGMTLDNIRAMEVQVQDQHIAVDKDQ